MTIVGDSKVKLGPVEYCWVAKKNGVYPYGITGSISAGSDAGMARAKAFVEMAETVPAGTQSSAVADNRVYAGFRQISNTAPSATLGVLVFDRSIITALRGSTVYTEGEYEISWRSQQCLTLADCIVVLNGRARSEDSGAANLQGWWTKIYPSIELTQIGMTHSGSSSDIQQVNFEATMYEVDTTPWGELITTNYGQTYGFSTDPIITDYPITMHTFVGNNSTDNFDLDETPAATDGDKVPMWEDGTKLVYTTAYSVSTKTVTFVAAPGASVVEVTAYQFTVSC